MTMVICLLFGGAALMLGMDAGWDLRNHHFYNGWAFLNGAMGRDVLVAQTDGFLNPVMDAVYAFLATHFQAMPVGFALAFLHGLNFPLLFAICWRILEVRNPNRRILVAGALSLAGLVGAAGLGMLGTAMHGNLVAAGILVSVLVTVNVWDDITEGSPMAAAVLTMLAGLPTGLAVGLDEPLVIYGVGMCAGFLVTDLPAMRRLWLIFWLACGLILGMLVAGGFWTASLWAAYGNPVFPFFNNVFHSPWAENLSYHDPAYAAEGVWGMIKFAVSFPFLQNQEELPQFRDFRVFAVLILVPLAAIASLMKRDRDPGVVTQPGPTGWLLTAAFTAFVLWVVLFGTYRLLVALEMLAPLVIVAAAGCLPMHRSARRGLGGLVVLFAVVTTLPAEWGRIQWQEQSVSATVPPVAEPSRTLVLMTGRAPLSFLVPLFPRDMLGFWRIGSDFAIPHSANQGFANLFQDGIAAHGGIFRSLHATRERSEAMVKLAEYGLVLDAASCRRITSPIGEGEYSWCEVNRQDAEQQAEPAEIPPAE